jgi:hypothetical protein
MAMERPVVFWSVIIVVVIGAAASIAYLAVFRAWLDRRPKWFRILVLGFGRLICIVTGFKGSSIHNAASLYILFAGFLVEVVVLGHFLVDRSEPVRPPNSEADTLIRSIILLLVLPLFAHQFMIFRNFTVPHFAGRGSDDESQQQETPKSTSDEDTKCDVGGSAGSAGFGILSFVRGMTEFLIYLAFGVITGEAGYLYAVGFANDSHSAVFEWVRDCLVRTMSLQQALEGLFFVGALVVCILVFLWDILTTMLMCFKPQGEALRRQYKPVIGWFFGLDSFSLGVWIVIASFMFPRLNNFLGSPSDYFKFTILLTIAALYLVSNLVRLVFGIVRLGKAESFYESQSLAI